MHQILCYYAVIDNIDSIESAYNFIVIVQLLCSIINFRIINIMLHSARCTLQYYDVAKLK